MIKNALHYSIFNGTCFVPFKGIRKIENRKTLTLKFSDNTILVATPNHLLQLADNSFEKADEIQIGQEVKGNIKVVEKIENKTPGCVFDAIGVVGGNVYQTNNVISHNCSFIGSSTTLIDQKKLQEIALSKPFKTAGNLFYYKLVESSHQYVITIDVSRGRGRDYTAFSVIDITKLPYEVVATFKDNTIQPSVELPLLADKIGRYYNNAMIAVENNDLGESVANSLWYDHEYENLLWSKDGEITSKGVAGYRTTKKLKTVGLNNLKLLIENDQLILNDERIIRELEVFVRKTNWQYGAQDTKINDDLIATLWGFAWLEKTKYFEDITHINSANVIGKSFADMVDDYLPIGFKNDANTIIEDEENLVKPLTKDEISMIF